MDKSNIKKQKLPPMSFGQILAAHRKAQKYSLRNLATLCGVSASYLGRLEKDEASATYEVIQKISTALGLEPSEFFPGNGGFTPSYRAEFGKVLESRAIQAMLRSIATLDPYAQRAIAVATSHWVELLKRGLHPVAAVPGTYTINEKFIEELESLKNYMSP
jgi:transcriptional regulator with XRE-family HTH domain